jgi:hypothetical protein
LVRGIQMDEHLRSDASAGLAATLATLMEQTAATVEDGPALDLLIEGAITDHRLGGSGRSDLTVKLQSLRESTSRMFGRTGPSACLVDTTLLASIAASTVGPDPNRSFTSLSLLDLAAFAQAVVLYDHIVVLPGAVHAAEMLNDKLGVSVVIPLQVPLEADENGGLLGFSAVLGNLFETVLYELGAVREADADSAVREDLQAMMKSWGTLLGRNLHREDVLLSPLDEWANWDSDGPGLLSQLVAIEGHTRDGHNGIFENAIRFPRLFEHLFNDPDLRLAAFISESNHRSYFNLRLSYLLGIPYVSSAARLPFRSQLYRNASFVHHQLLLQREIDRYADRRAYHVPDRPAMSLPAFAAIALHRASSLSDVLPQIAELRNTASAIRRRRAAWEEALRLGENKTVDRLREAIDGDAIALRRELIGPVATAVSASLAAAASPTTALTVSLVGITGMIGSMSSERREAILRRLLRPAEWFLTSTSDNARNIADLKEKVSRLWSLDDTTTDWTVARMHQLSKLPPA